VGSDLDLLLVDASADGPQHQRLLRWPLEQMDPALYANRPLPG